MWQRKPKKKESTTTRQTESPERETLSSVEEQLCKLYLVVFDKSTFDEQRRVLQLLLARIAINNSQGNEYAAVTIAESMHDQVMHTVRKFMERNARD